MQKSNSLLASLILGLSVGFPVVAAEATAPFAGSALRGHIVYQKACAACHGENGNGQGPGAKALNPKPRDFTSGLYKFRTTGLGELPTDADLIKVLENGVPSTQMPSFKNVLTAQEKVDVVAYIKDFSSDFADAEEEAEIITLPKPPASTAAFVAEGKKVFMTLDCWTCHGPEGKGNGSAGASLKDAAGNPIKPFNLTRTSYKGGADAANIYRTIHTGLNGTPMSAFGGAFLYGSDRTVNEKALETVYSKAEINTLKAYLAAQPTQEAARALDAEDQVTLTQKRKWALVHYVRSLQKKPGILGWLTSNTEVTK